MKPEQEKLIEELKEFQERLRDDVEWAEEDNLVSAAIAELERLIAENERSERTPHSKQQFLKTEKVIDWIRAKYVYEHPTNITDREKVVLHLRNQDDQLDIHRDTISKLRTELERLIAKDKESEKFKEKVWGYKPIRIPSGGDAP